MRYLIILIAVILIGCSQKKEVAEEVNEYNDTSGAVNQRSTSETVKIDFPLDSLLKFDSENELKKSFGDYIKHATGYYPEGMGEYENTLLFPGTKNQVEFVWKDDSVNFSGLFYIRLSGQETDWKTKEGITLGTKLKELEKLNRKPFTFYGFGWDYGGATNWDNGHLQDRKVFVSLEYPGGEMPPEFEPLLGDHEVKSTDKLAQKANPVVDEITMRR